jgi:hypothetical protein
MITVSDDDDDNDDDNDDVYSEYYSGKGFHINYSPLRKTHKLVR